MSTPSQYAPGQTAQRGRGADPRAAGTQPPEPVNPLGALQNFYTRFGRLSGRASRSELWWMVLWSVLASYAGAVIVWAFGAGALEIIEDQDPASLNGFGRGFAAVWGLLGLVHVIPWLTLSARRLHDVDRSGFWLLAALIPVAGFVFLLICAVMPSTPRAARFDRGAAEQEERDRIAAGFG